MHSPESSPIVSAAPRSGAWIKPALLLLGLVLFPGPVFPGQFSVSPITLEFEPGAKTGVVTVANDEDRPLQIQVKAFEWLQDAQGADQYTETDDILFFPKIMLINKKDERLLRVGLKNPPMAREKTYRLFMEEIPDPGSAGEGTRIRVAIRFGIPIFVKPQKDDPQGAIEALKLKDGRLQTMVRNTGNTHFVIQSIQVRGTGPKGGETFSKEISGWYLLAGSARTYETEISPESCRETRTMEVTVQTNEITLNGKLQADPSICAP